VCAWYETCPVTGRTKILSTTFTQDKGCMVHEAGDLELNLLANQQAANISDLLVENCTKCASK